MQSKEYLKLKHGYRTALSDGTMVPQSPMHMATERFYHAVQGSRLRICVGEYLFAVAIFSLERDLQYIYSYAYQKEENWTTYTQNLTPQSYQNEDYIFDKECFFRVCVRRQDGKNLDVQDIERAQEIMLYFHEEPVYIEKEYFQEEVEETVATIQAHHTDNMLKLCLLTDTHYTINGTWDDTAHNIFKVSEQIDYDGIIHLGDFTDGMVSKELTQAYVNLIFRDLDKCEVPVYVAVGNHDSNYFRNGENIFTTQEMKELYRLPGEGLDYYIDLEKYQIRMIFLSSFEDSQPVRYGYSDEQIEWLKKTLYSACKGTRFLIFSHDAPLAKLDYWSFLIRNGEALLELLEECNAHEDYQIIGFFYGHVHGDMYFAECSFPIISVGCAKLEYFKDKKPKGLVTPERNAGTVTQDLWDSLLIDFVTQKIKLIRFGAGENREISYAKKKSIYKDILMEQYAKRTMKVWAHRGASAHAPENTLPAFRLANELKADGIELDVQLTKDGIPIVIHDETVDRVSDGSGWVKDLTYEQIRKLNVNKHFKAYGMVTIPTLEEVYDFVKTTNMVVNVELKNNVVSYEGLEEKVLKIAEQKGIADRVVYSSFNHYSMKRVKDLRSDAKVAFLCTDGIINIAEYAKMHGAYAVHLAMYNMQFGDIVQECHKKGIRVHVWTVNEGAEFCKMRQMGVDAVITNYAERG